MAQAEVSEPVKAADGAVISQVDVKAEAEASVKTPVRSKTTMSEPLDVTGAASVSISPELRKKVDQKMAAKRKPHDAAFTGWREVTGWEEGDDLTEDDQIMDLLTRSTFLEQYLPEAAYGDWYHIAAILILGSLLTWALGYFRFGVGLVFFIVLPVALYYRTCIRKYRGAIRIEAQREFSVKAIEDDFETMDWMNVFLEKLWPHVEPYVSEQVCAQANPILADLPIPAFVKQVWIHTFTVGTKAPRVDKVRTLDRTGDDVTVMDWWVSFSPNALEDTTIKQLKNRTNQKVIVKAKLFGLTIPVDVSDCQMHAKIRLRLRMMTNFPHIQTVNVSLMEPPIFDAITKPVGGDTIFSPEVFSIPGLYMLINEMILKFAGPMVFTPLSFQLNLEQLLAGNGLGGALGILELTIKDATGLKGADTFNNTIDPYFTFGTGATVLAKTDVVPDTTNPVFNQIVNVLLKSSTEPLAIYLYDENESDGRKDKFMGAALYDLDTIMTKEEIPDITLPILRNNRPAGQIRFGLKLMKSLEGSKMPDGSYSAPPDLNTGVVTFQLLGARSYSEDDDKPGSVQAFIYVNREKKLESAAVKKAKDATWALSFDDIVTDKAHCSVRVVLKDPTSKDGAVIGSTTLRLTDIIDSSYVDNEWFPMNTGTGEVKLHCDWSSVHMTGVAGAIGYTEPIGVVRVFIEKAEDLRNIEKFGTIDPYVRLMINGVQRGRTLTKESTTSPKFMQSLYIPVSSANQRITIEGMDLERNQPDRTLGSFEVRLDKFIDYDDKNVAIETVGESQTNSLVSRKGVKGSVTYSLAFFPCTPVETPAHAEKRAKRHAELESIVKKKEEAKEDAEPEKDELAELDDAKKRTLLAPDALASQSTGILVFSLLEGKFSQDGYLQAFFDKEGDPLFETRVRSRSKHISAVGDAMIKELAYSTVTFRYTKNKGSNIQKDALAEVTIPTAKLLASTYDNATTISLGSNKLTLSSQFIPVELTELPPVDSIGNSGTLDVKIISATGLPAADKNGKSDPFCRLYINGEEAYKTKTKKKTLEPEWNEETQISIDNRVGSFIRFKVVDWDLGVESDDELGEFNYALAQIDPFNQEWQDVTVALADEDNKPAGELILQFKFTAEYHTVLSAEKALPNVGVAAVGEAGKVVGDAGKLVGAVGGTGVKAVGAVGGVVGGTASKAVKGVTGLFKKH